MSGNAKIRKEVAQQAAETAEESGDTSRFIQSSSGTIKSGNFRNCLMNVKLPDFIPFDPNTLLGYQKRWIADDSQLKIAEKSRRTGLTWAEAADDVLIASQTKSDGGSGCVLYWLQQRNGTGNLLTA